MHIKNPSLIGLTVDKHNERRETYENIEWRKNGWGEDGWMHSLSGKVDWKSVVSESYRIEILQGAVNLEFEIPDLNLQTPTDLTGSPPFPCKFWEQNL
jgi:hypothetical protein